MSIAIVSHLLRLHATDTSMRLNTDNSNWHLNLALLVNCVCSTCIVALATTNQLTTHQSARHNCAPVNISETCKCETTANKRYRKHAFRNARENMPAKQTSSYRECSQTRTEQRSNAAATKNCSLSLGATWGPARIQAHQARLLKLGPGQISGEPSKQANKKQAPGMPMTQDIEHLEHLAHLEHTLVIGARASSCLPFAVFGFALLHLASAQASRQQTSQLDAFGRL